MVFNSIIQNDGPNPRNFWMKEELNSPWIGAGPSYPRPSIANIPLHIFFAKKNYQYTSGDDKQEQLLDMDLIFNCSPSLSSAP